MERPSIDAAAIAAASLVNATIAATAAIPIAEHETDADRSWPDRVEQLYARFYDFVRNYEQPPTPLYEGA